MIIPNVRFTSELSAALRELQDDGERPLLVTPRLIQAGVPAPTGGIVVRRRDGTELSDAEQARVRMAVAAPSQQKPIADQTAELIPLIVAAAQRVKEFELRRQLHEHTRALDALNVLLRRAGVAEYPGCLHR